MTTIHDLLARHGITPIKASTRKGGEFSSECPICGPSKTGKPSDRFRSWPDQGEGGSWWCRGCDKGGDLIEFLKVYDGMSYKNACQFLGVEMAGATQKRTPKPRKNKSEFVPSERQQVQKSWVERAADLVTVAAEALALNPDKLAWLESRGISAETAKAFGLGWVEKDFWRTRPSWGLPDVLKDDGKKKMLWVPSGLVIPAFDGGHVARVRFRRFDGDPKYYVLPGSGGAPFIARAQAPTVVVVESELDAIAICNACPETVGAYAAGSATAKPDAAAHAILKQKKVILVAMDFDSPDSQGRMPGAAASKWWLENYSQAIRWPVPVGKDPGEASRHVDLAAWVSAGLPGPVTLGASVAGQHKGGEGKKPPAVPRSASVAATRLFALLSDHQPLAIDKTAGLALVGAGPGWHQVNKEASEEITALMFGDAFDHVISHNSKIINSENFWC